MSRVGLVEVSREVLREGLREGGVGREFKR